MDVKVIAAIILRVTPTGFCKGTNHLFFTCTAALKKAEIKPSRGLRPDVGEVNRHFARRHAPFDRGFPEAPETLLNSPKRVAFRLARR